MPKQYQDAPYYDYHEVDKEVEANLGKRLRDYAGKFGGPNGRNDDVPYLDFWHKMLEWLDGHGFCNGIILPINFTDMGEYFVEKDLKNTWIKEICDEFNRVLGDPPEDEYGERAFRMKFEW